MSENNGSNRFNREADILIELGTLLRKERSPERQEEVQQIYDSSLSVEQKVAQIRRIDEEEGRGESEAEAETGPMVGNDSHTASRHKKRAGTGSAGPSKNRRHDEAGERNRRNERYFGTSPERDKPAHKRKKIRKHFTLKHNFQKLGYFTFLFKHYHRMKEFGYATKTMVPTVFPPGLKVDRELKSSLEIKVKPLAKEIAIILNQLMGNSWLFLRKKEYNLLVILIDLCQAVEQSDFTSIDFNVMRQADKLIKIEQLFLLLHYRSEYVELIHSSIQTLLEKNRRSIRNLDSLPKMIKKILTAQEMQPSLYHTLLALSMLRSRRYHSLDELLIHGHGELIETKQFDCTVVTDAKIEEHLHNLVLQLDVLEKERKEIYKVRIYLQKDEIGNMDLSPLRMLYERGDPSQRVSFTQDQDRLHIFLQRFCFAYLSVFEDLLCSQIKLSGIGRVRLFEGDPFRKELGRLQTTASKCEDLSFQLPVFSKKRFLEITLKHAQAIELEAEVVSLIDEVVSAVHTIGERLSTLLQSVSSERVLGDREFEPVYIGPGEARQIRLPMGNVIEETGTLLDGGTLSNALSLLISVSYLFGFLFNDRRTLQLLRREEQVNHDMEAILENFERIASPEQYHDIRERFFSL